MVLNLAKSSKGNLSELKVMAAYTQAGFIVSVPFGGGASYDLIVDTGTRLLKVQVKTGRLRNGCVIFPMQRFSGHKKGRRYDPKEFNVFVVYCPDNDSTYAIDFDKSLSQGRLRCVETRNNQKEKIRWASEFDFGDHVKKLIREREVELRGLEPLTS
ncbi:MAG: group I intron-associated PD-(D/E)XK endonuclease [Blastocatellia bacterium]